jgi:hypothetical protein
MPVVFDLRVNTVYESGSQCIRYPSIEDHGFACPFILFPALAGSSQQLDLVS